MNTRSIYREEWSYIAGRIMASEQNVSCVYKYMNTNTHKYTK